MSALPQLEIDSTVASGESAIARAAAYGIDVTLLQAMLRRTPTERLQMLQSMLDLHTEQSSEGIREDVGVLTVDW